MGDTVMSALVELTPKQAMFAELVARGATYSDAYREAYDAHDWKAGSVNTASSALMKVEHVSARVEALKAHHSLTRDAQDRQTRVWVLDRLRMEAMDRGNPGATRVRALNLIGADAGMWSKDGGPTGDDAPMSQEDAEKALMRLLKQAGKVEVQQAVGVRGTDIGEEEEEGDGRVGDGRVHGGR